MTQRDKPVEPLRTERDTLKSLLDAETKAKEAFKEAWSLQLDEGKRLLDKLDAERARVKELERENARLKNYLNEGGLHDPDLAKIAGKPINIFDAAAQGPREFDPNALTPSDTSSDKGTTCSPHDWQASELDGWICAKCGEGHTGRLPSDKGSGG